MANFLTAKVGPFPTWAWIGLGAGVVVVVRYRQAQAAQAAAASSSTIAGGELSPEWSQPYTGQGALSTVPLGAISQVNNPNPPGQSSGSGAAPNFGNPQVRIQQTIANNPTPSPGNILFLPR